MMLAVAKEGEDGAVDVADEGCSRRKLYNMEGYHGRSCIAKGVAMEQA